MEVQRLFRFISSNLPDPSCFKQRYLKPFSAVISSRGMCLGWLSAASMAPSVKTTPHYSAYTHSANHALTHIGACTLWAKLIVPLPGHVYLHVQARACDGQLQAVNCAVPATQSILGLLKWDKRATWPLHYTSIALLVCRRMLEHLPWGWSVHHLKVLLTIKNLPQLIVYTTSRIVSAIRAVYRCLNTWKWNSLASKANRSHLKPLIAWFSLEKQNDNFSGSIHVQYTSIRHTSVGNPIRAGGYCRVLPATRSRAVGLLAAAASAAPSRGAIGMQQETNVHGLKISLCTTTELVHVHIYLQQALMKSVPPDLTRYWLPEDLPTILTGR